MIASAASAAEGSAQTKSRLKSGGFGKPDRETTKFYKPVPIDEEQEDRIVYCDPEDDHQTIFIQIKSMPIVYDYKKSSDELRAMSSRKYFSEEGEQPKEKEGLYLKHQTEMHKKFKRTIGLTRTWTEGVYELNPMVVGRKKYGCYYLSALQYDILYNIKVYIAEELLNNVCKRERVLEHEMLHVAVKETLIPKYEERIKTRLETYIKSYKPRRLYVNEYSAETSRIIEEIDDILEPIYAEWRQKTDELNIMIDSVGEYSYNSYACRQ